MKDTISQTTASPLISFGDPRWYHALSLAERGMPRIDGQSSQPPFHMDYTLAEHRLREWQAQPAFTKKSLFEERLAADKLTERDFLILLGEPIEVVQQRTTVPEWLIQLNEIVSETEVPDEDWLAEGNSQELSLLNVIDLLLKDGLDRLQAGISEIVCAYKYIPFEEDSIARVFLPHLIHPLMDALNRTIVLEVNVARLLEKLQGDTPEERFQDFIRQTRQKNALLALFEEYPVLARQVLNIIHRWRTYALEFLRHLCNDWEHLCATFAPASHNLGMLVEVKGGAGDTHRGGRSVLIIAFSSGVQLVYKPKSLAVDVHFQELLIWLNEQGFQPSFRTIKLLDCGSYGWSEYVDGQNCQIAEEVTRFYERQGGYLALLYALNATDFHYENLIAVGEHPVLIDLEALFHHKPMTGNEQPDVAFDVMHSSVMRVGLLPNRLFANGNNPGMDISGLGGRGGQQAPLPIPHWENANTDQIRIVRQHFMTTERRNRPKLENKEVNFLDYSDAIIRGFTRMYRLLIEHRAALIGGPLLRFANDEIRTIVRPTAFYNDLQRESFHPDLLRDALDRDSHFDHLWLAASKIAYLTKLVKFERLDLLAGDIPMFTTFPASRDVYSSQGECIPNYFAQSSLEIVKDILQSLDENDLQRQTWFITASFASTQMGKGASSWKHPSQGISTGKAVTYERLLKAAQAVGDRLCDIAVRDVRGANWVGLSLIGERQWMLTSASPDLYSGNAGILLFLSYLGIITGEERYTETAEAAYVTMRKQLESMQDTLKSLGGFDGWGAWIYLLAHLGTIWNDPTLFSEAEEMVKRLPDLVEKDAVFDVLAGSAGCILSLASLYRVAPSATVLSTAIQCGEHLMAAAQPMAAGVAWKSTISATAPLAGFSHGAAGCMLSLLTLAELSGDLRFRQTARGALEYERSVFSPEAKNWPDFRELEGAENNSQQAKDGPIFMTTWCHGAPGIGMSRLAALRYIDDEKIREEIRTALDTTIESGFGLNHSLCHGDLGNLDALLLATQTLDDPYYREQLQHFTSVILDSIEVDGWLTGIPHGVESPGLMTGLAGIGYELLRLAEPERVPSVLILAPPIDK